MGVTRRVFSAGTAVHRHQRVAAWYGGVSRGCSRCPYRSLIVIVAAVQRSRHQAAFLDLAERVRRKRCLALDHRAWAAARASLAGGDTFFAWTWLGTPVGIAAVLRQCRTPLLIRRRRILPSSWWRPRSEDGAEPPAEGLLRRRPIVTCAGVGLLSQPTP
jgi:hypothetical protein